MNCDCFLMSPFSPRSFKSWMFCVHFFMSLCHTLVSNALVCPDLAYCRGFILIKYHTWQDHGFLQSDIIGAVPAMNAY